GPHSHTNYPWGWAQCGNAPFKWYKQNTHEGGVHVPMIVHWPAGIDAAQRGTLRRQFVNVADIVPTLYELLGVTPPGVFQGRAQLPVTGHSFAHVLAEPEAPASNRLQYFEMVGSRALVAELDGRCWKAVTRHRKGVPFDEDRWELYDLDADASECDDLAAVEPERLTQLVELWWQEAERYGVLPLDDRTIELFRPQPNDHSVHRRDRRYRYRPPMTPLPVAATPSPGGMAWDLAASVTRGADDEGVLYATGNANSGMSIFVQGGRLVVDYNAFGEHTIVESEREVPVGDAVLSVHLRRLQGFTGTLTLAIDGEACGHVELPLMMMMMSSVGASVGQDHGLPVSDRYDGAFAFGGILHQVDIEVGSRANAEDAAQARMEMARQ
ncbi:MAG: sulfatase/phosphatase domain-containing protein, partial [Pseudomonadales bacterium]|nr:sulfatase/phosphatase domain-containing protein [Pseudomonadales bacterium]